MEEKDEIIISLSDVWNNAYFVFVHYSWKLL